MKKHGMKKRVLAAFMTACMVVGAVPGVSLADTESGTKKSVLEPGELKYEISKKEPGENGPIKLDKKAEYLGEDKYKITLTADTSDAADLIKPQNIEVAVIVDASGSMNFCEKPDNYDEWDSYVNDWGWTLWYKHEHKSGWRNHETECTAVNRGLANSRWNIVKNAINETTGSDHLGKNVNFNYVYFKGTGDGWTSDVGSSDSSYSNITPFGKTPLIEGIEKGIDALKDKETNYKALIILADGASDDGYNSEKLKNFKQEGGIVYTVGFTFNDARFNALSSGKDYSFNVSDADKLTEALNKIGTDLTSIITDPLGDNVDIVENTKIEVSPEGSTVNKENNANGTTIKWKGNMGGIVTLSYVVELNDKAKKKAGRIYLNGDATLNYSYTEDGTSKNMAVAFPKPYITASTLKVNYKNNDTVIAEDELEWVPLFKGDEKFVHEPIQKNSEITGADGKTYFVTENATVTKDGEIPKSMNVEEAIPQILEGAAYTVDVAVNEKTVEKTYTVSYDVKGIAKTEVNLPWDGEQYQEGAEVTIPDAPKVDGYTFKGWKYEGLRGTDVEYGKFNMPDHDVTLIAVYQKDEKPQIPNKPAATDLASQIVVECQNAEASGHQSKAYTVSDRKSYEIGNVELVGDQYQCQIKIIGAYYASLYNKDVNFKHNVTVDDVYYTLTWDAKKEAWIAPAATDIGTVKVDCSSIKPETPTNPVATDLASQIVVECQNAEVSGHQSKAYTVSDRKSYEIGNVELVGDQYQCQIKIIGSYYASLYNKDVNFKHNVTVDDVYYTLTWDAEKKAWIAPAVTEIDTVKVDCSSIKPETPAKPVATDLPEVIVECTNADRTHDLVSKTYPISKNFKIGDVTEKDGKFVSKVTVDGLYYANMFNEDCGVKHPVTVTGTEFYMTWDAKTEEWKAPAATSIKSIEVTCADSKDPILPEYENLKNLLGDVTLVHTGSNAEHPDKKYELLENSYEIARTGKKASVTVNSDPYVKDYNSEYGEHTVNKKSVKVQLVYTENGWNLTTDEPLTFVVKCSKQQDTKPNAPKYEDLKELFEESITVTCTTDKDHKAQTFGLIKDSYGVKVQNEDGEYTATVSVRADKYIKNYLDGKHENAGKLSETVEFYYDKDDAKWYPAVNEISINFKAKCEKKAPEKQYTDIKFVVENGTFTENGKTEITKTFEVGTKLTIADIPESKGNRGYTDQTWDKYPLNYVVKEEGTTFTITYRWRSSGSSDSDNDYEYTNTRGKATNAAGKSGRWILEGGEFTEDNGRLPSNEYLKIGDTIYGFYTYGFAIDFDRPEYYTDAAIQAKGGYRDATGTWRLNGWWFCYDDGTFPHNEWVYLTWNGHSDWYYFDVDGWMEDGWLYQNNNWYYLHTKYDNTRGHMYTGWHEIDGKWYYFNTASDKGTLGAMLANTTTPDGYQVDANGAWIQ